MLYIDGPFGIVKPAIVEYQLCVIHKGLEVGVLVCIELVFNGTYICKGGWSEVYLGRKKVWDETDP